MNRRNLLKASVLSFLPFLSTKETTANEKNIEALKALARASKIERGVIKTPFKEMDHPEKAFGALLNARKNISLEDKMIFYYES